MKRKATPLLTLQPTLVWDKPGLVAGVDEAGRGPLAGPVVAAAVILNDLHPIKGLDDSKKLTARKREKLFDEIMAKALCVSVAQASVEEIDRLNILQATMLAMQRAVQALSPAASEAWIDGNRCPKLACRARAFVQGDRLHPVISALRSNSRMAARAGSICSGLANMVRDRPTSRNTGRGSCPNDNIVVK